MNFTHLKATIRTNHKNVFKQNLSYVVAGGFGGLGRSIIRWMVDRGARHLIILSRSGPRTDAARSLVQELGSRGVHIATPEIDISDLRALQTSLAQLEGRHDMPPIRGCIQATVVLRDNFWPNMSFRDWQASTNSKITGSWNLHVALPQHLDFFVLVSSINGLFGNRSQANYAAGNTFKDALAHHRLSNGQKAVSIDLGLMVDAGMVADNDKLLAGMRRIGHLIDIRTDEFLALLEHYCDPDLPLLARDEAQILVGIEGPAAVLAKGAELHHSIHRPLFSQLFAVDRRSGSAPGAHEGNANTRAPETRAVDRKSVLRDAASDEEATALVLEWLKTKTALLLGIGAEDIDMARPAHSYGMDSLVSIDLKNWLSREIGFDVQVFQLLGNISLGELAGEAAVKSRFRTT